MANEKRLIDKDALIEDLEAAKANNGMGGMVASALIRYVKRCPTVDAVEVVRCRDCRNSMLWRKPVDKVIGECFIRKMNSEDEQFCMVGADDFCSYGELKTEDP